MKNVMVFAAAMLVTAAAQAQDRMTVDVQMKMPLETKTLKGAPYSAEVVNDHIQILSDGNRIVQHSTSRVFRDSEGRVRREEDRAGGNPSVSIVDPVAGVSYSLDPDRKIAWKTPSMTGIAIMNKVDSAKVEAMKAEMEKVATLKERLSIETRRSSAREQRADEKLPPRTLEGLRVEGHRTTTTIPVGAVGNELPIAIVSEEWTSPDLQVLVLTDRKDPRNGDTTYRLQNVARTEPAAWLFQVPSDYEVRETGIRKFDRELR
jgi:hypothetical protein